MSTAFRRTLTRGPPTPQPPAVPGVVGWLLSQAGGHREPQTTDQIRCVEFTATLRRRFTLTRPPDGLRD